MTMRTQQTEPLLQSLFYIIKLTNQKIYMFGKINFALGINSSKPQQSNSTPQLQNNNQPHQPQSYQGKSFLANPTFNKNTQKTSNKQQPKQESDSKHTQKTKHIQKPQFNPKDNKHNSQAKTNKPNSLQSQMQGSKFRILNELLYTSSSQEAMTHFQQNPEDYLTYHEGYRSQSQKWQSKPVNILIKYFRKSFKQYRDKVICDLGCGEGFLFEGLTKQKYQKEDQSGNVNEVKNKHVFKESNILSFDLVALKPFIKVADIKNIPLEKGSADVAVFCLSLMGKNYLEFIRQAHRILKQSTGQLIIAEVQSRSKNWKAFVDMIQMLGFQLSNNGVHLGSKADVQQGKKLQQNKGRYFRILHFVKNSQNAENIRKIRHEDKNFGKQEITELSQLLLTECIYKKR